MSHPRAGAGASASQGHEAGEREAMLVRTMTPTMMGAQGLVTRLKADLENNLKGLRCWLDLVQLVPGAHVDETRRQGVREADVFVCCLTDQYFDTACCRAEWAWAKEQTAMAAKLGDAQGFCILPVLLDGFSGSFGAGAYLYL